MNISQLVSSIKMDLGIYALKLPFDDADNQLMEVIKLKTLKTFSTFYPQMVTISVDLATDLDAIKEEYTESCYILPDWFGGREIMWINNITPKSKLLGNGYISPVFDGSVETYNMMMMTQANANLASVAAPPITFKFEAPNKLYIYNMATAYGKVDLEIAVAHSENLVTIPNTAWETFYELALLDIKRFLYNAMKHYTEIQTAYGSLHLKIDSWESAESERKDLIEKLRDIYHLEASPLFII